MAHALDAVERCHKNRLVADIAVDDLRDWQHRKGGVSWPMREGYDLMSRFGEPSYNRVAHEPVGAGHKYAH
ncbi:hypothetical protein SAVIM338S_02888 [Streptomyces avidinii]